MKVKSKVTIVFQREVIGYSVWMVDLPGCISQGDSFEDAMESIKDAAQLYLETFPETEIETTPVESVEIDDNQFLVITDLIL